MTLLFPTTPSYPLASGLLTFDMLWFWGFFYLVTALEFPVLNHSETSWYPSWKTGSAHFVSGRFVLSAASKRVSCVHQITFQHVVTELWADWLKPCSVGRALWSYMFLRADLFCFFLLCKALWGSIQVKSATFLSFIICLFCFNVIPRQRNVDSWWSQIGWTARPENRSAGWLLGFCIR